MQWTEVSLQTTHEQADTIADILYSAGAQGVAMEDPLLINQLRSSGTWELCGLLPLRHITRTTINCRNALHLSSAR